MGSSSLQPFYLSSLFGNFRSDPWRLRKLRLPSVKRLGADPHPLSHFADRISTLDNLRHSVLLNLIRKPNALVHIRLSLVPKLPSKASINLGAPHDALIACYRQWRGYMNSFNRILKT